MGARHSALILAAGLALAGCQTVAQSALPPSPEHPGTRVTMKNPDPTKWAQIPPTPQTQANKILGWACRPLACSGQATVAAQMTQSPTRNPDRKALEKAAKLLPTQAKAQDMMVDAASEGTDHVASLSSRVGEERNYPAILSETKRTSHGKATFTMRGDLFVGLLQVKIIATAPEREEAKRYFDSFVAAMDIIDVDAPPPPAGQTTTGPVALDADTAPPTQ